jgi:hypothetical protein
MKGRAPMGGKNTRLATDERHDVTRVEAFSDGVFAIAITLLVLNIHIPTAADAGQGGLAGRCCSNGQCIWRISPASSPSSSCG